MLGFGGIAAGLYFFLWNKDNGGDVPVPNDVDNINKMLIEQPVAGIFQSEMWDKMSPMNATIFEEYWAITSNIPTNTSNEFQNKSMWLTDEGYSFETNEGADCSIYPGEEPDRCLGMFKEGKAHGIMRIEWPNGTVSEETFYENMRHGLARRIDENEVTVCLWQLNTLQFTFTFNEDFMEISR